MKTKLTFFIFVLSIFSCNTIAQSNYGLTTFGTDKISASAVLEKYGELLDELIELNNEDSEEYDIKKQLLEGRLNENKLFSYVNINLFTSYSGKTDFIIDFVDKNDANSRLEYRVLKTKKLGDPDDLIAKWEAYAKLSRDLFDKGEVNDMQCPVVHCTWSFNHPNLKPFLTYFETNVPKNIGKLKELLEYSDEPRYRANAAFLLAHADIETQNLVKILEPAIEDPSSLVRNNSMRVIYYSVRENNNLDIPLDKVIKVLNYPSFTDRNKALVVLRSLPTDKFSKKQLNKVLPILLEILEKKDAHNYKNAHTVLKNISGKEYTIDEIDKWEVWVKSFV